MYNSNLLHERVMRRYDRIKTQKVKEHRAWLDFAYEKLPQLRDIDNSISSLALKHSTRIITDKITPKQAVTEMEKEKKILEDKRNKLIKESALNIPDFKPYVCNKCRDTGFANGEKCECYMNYLQEIMRSGIKGSSGITSDFASSTFDKFELKWYDKSPDVKSGISPYENMKSVLRECKLFCFDFEEKGGNLYFYGKSGTGKTFMASCIANDLIKQGRTVMYQSAYKLFQLMEDYKFSKINRDEYSDEYNSVYNSDLLIIDDLGTEFTTTYTCSVFFDILNTRILNKKSTVISTNLSVNNLAEKYTERVSSRIIGNFEMMRFMGDDIRIIKKYGK